MVNCAHGRGAIVHQCKISDHEEVCYQKRVPCINAVYGCEAVMPRNIKVHLAHCQILSANISAYHIIACVIYNLRDNSMVDL